MKQALRYESFSFTPFTLNFFLEKLSDFFSNTQKPLEVITQILLSESSTNEVTELPEMEVVSLRSK